MPPRAKKILALGLVSQRSSRGITPNLIHQVFLYDFNFQYFPKNFESFYTDGCENCKDFLPLMGNRKLINECTSNNFMGTIMLMDPSASWVARYQRIDDFCPGMYAASVFGSVSDEVRIKYLLPNRVELINRDTSVKQ